MRKYLSKKSAILGSLIVVIAAATAFAYLSSTGKGSGSGTTSGAVSQMNLTSSDPTLANIGDSKTITVTASNSNASPQAMEEVTISVAAKNSDCPSESFTLGGATATSKTLSSNVNVPAKSGTTNGTAQVASTTIQFNNNASAAQNACLSGYDITLSGGAAPVQP